jgi:hypothetical protein
MDFRGRDNWQPTVRFERNPYIHISRHLREERLYIWMNTLMKRSTHDHPPMENSHSGKCWLRSHRSHGHSMCRIKRIEGTTDTNPCDHCYSNRNDSNSFFAD